jgi:ABC-2 type transport system permease protein
LGVPSTAFPPASASPGGLRYDARVLRVIAGTEFKLKYADSVLGYVWSLIKPLALFSVLYVVFGRFFNLTVGLYNYPLYLLTGLVLWGFFADGTTVSMPSVVSHGSLLRRLAFPRLLIPASATVTAAMTFAVNLLALTAFVAWNRIVPGPSWLLLPVLFLELYVFIFSVGLILATMYVRFRDTGQMWELGAQLLFWSSPIIYPVQFLPPWAQPIAFFSPFVQVMQDVRAIILGGENVVGVTDILGRAGHAAPLGVLLVTLAFALLLFKREEAGFAERI